MRITPLVVWCSLLPQPADIKKAINEDADFTHPNPLVKDAIFIYALTIIELLNNN